MQVGTSLVLAVGFLALGLPATPAAAVQATGGAARFPSIEWFSWGADGSVISNNGVTRTEHYTLAGQSFDITCSISNITRVGGTGTGSYLESYRSGTWQGDGFDQLYNIGGVDEANNMVVGLSNRIQGNTITLSFNCSATLGGNPFPLAGLVMADAEASGGTEYVGATIPTTATWRILDRVRGASCTLDAYARRTVAGTANRLELYGPVDNTCENGTGAFRPGPSAVAFMDGATSATNVTISGSGKSAIALGVAFNTDFGDAPDSYGDAGAALQYAYTGGEVPQTSSALTLAQNRGTPVFGSITLATNVQPSPRLGATVDPEATQEHSADATGDDSTGEAASGGPDDENGLTLANPIEVAPGGTTVIGPVSCIGTGYVAGWIDWNGNGTFDTSERSTSTPACPTGGSVNLSFAVPSTILGSGGTLNTFLRVRLAPTTTQLNPTGLSTGGEVEDYRLVAGAKPRIILRKTTLGASGGPYGFTLTNTLQGSGTVTTTTAGAATQVDGDPATTGNQAFLVTQTGTAVGINESTIPTGWALSSVSCTSGGQNVGSLSGTTLTLPASAIVPGAVITCDFRNGRPSIGLVKAAGTATGATAGSTLPYTFTVTNTGQTPLTSITITDPKVASVSCAATTLAIGASTTCTGNHTLTQAEVDAGTVVNSATVSGTPPSGTAVTSTAGTTSTIPRTPAISLTKSAGAPTGNTAGSTVTYSFLVTNTGNVTLTTVGVNDPTIGTVSCPATTLAPGAATTCTKTYALTQSDVNAGVVNNTATATGTPPSGSAVTASATANRSITRTAAITLDKQAGIPSGTAAGSSIAYDFVVTNTGNVTLTALSVLDAKTGPVSCPVSTLAPAASTTCTGTHLLTQADLDAGQVDNTATATANAPAGVTSPTATDTATVTVARTAAVTVDKQFGGLTDLDSNGQDAGDRLNYTFLVTNTGNVTLTSVTVTDPKVGTVSCPLTTLPSGAATSCTGSYLLTQADVDAGHVANTATATGTPPSGVARPTAIDSTDTPVTAGPAVSLDKTAGTPSGNTAGSTIAYSFLVTNSGNVTLTAVGVTDPKVGEVSCPSTSLAPGASTTCTKTYLLTQEDVDAGSVANTATANGTSPTNATVSATDSTISTITRSAALTMDKQAGTPSGGTAGSTIAYSFVVTNTGKVTVDGLAITDPDVTGLACPTTTLAPGETTTCTATHDLTQGDLDSGHVANTATVTGNPPTGVTTPNATDSTDIALAQAAAISLDKQAGTPSGDSVGSSIPYTFVVTNTGNVTLTAVNVGDPTAGTVTCPVTTLAPGAATTCVASYPITQADLDAGTVDNSATATGTPPGALAKPTSTDSTTSTLSRTAALTLDKQAGTAGTAAGSSIAYDFVVTNTGNVTLTALSVLDAKTGPVSCPVSTLLPGETTTCTAVYLLTQADLDAGVVDNTATASADAPAGLTSPTATDTATSTLTRTATLTLDKQAGTAGTAAGSSISYDFVVTNTGNVTLTALSVLDAKTGPVSCPVDTLLPGASTTCTASYVLTQADIDAGVVDNTASVTADAPAGMTPPSDTDTATVTIERTATITLDKQAGIPSGTTPGSTIAYSFTVLNTGNVTLTSVGVTDPRLGSVSCLAATLAPGASTTCSATYELTQADVDGGHVPNTATATGTPPTGLTEPTATDSTDTPLTSDPAMTLEKHSAAPTGNTAGSTIAYTFLVTNTGNVTLGSVAVTDAKVGAVTCPAATLAPGASTTCTASYTLTQADVDAGHVENTAAAVGTPPTGDPVTATDTITTPIAAAPAITVDKQAGTPSGAAAGSTIDFTFLVTNSGNVTLTSVGITDLKVGAVFCPATTLAPGASTTCSATYLLTQADVDAGHVANTATAAGEPPVGGPVSATDTTDTTIGAGPAIALAKTAGAPSGSAAGSTIAYSFLVTNTGNVTLSSVAVTDAKVGAVTCADTVLAPGGSTTCSATYTLTQADVDAGAVVNTASVAGNPPTGDPVIATDSATTTIPASPSIALDKTAGPASGSIAGSTIDFSFLVTNSGNVTLTSVGITDLKVGAVSCPVTTLAPGASTTCSATYLLTQADVDAGHVANTASVAGDPPTGEPVTAGDDTDTPITAGPSITLEKTAGAPSGNQVGSTIAYTFTVMNTGNVTLTSVEVTDPKVGVVSCPETSLASGASTTCSATYVLTQADVDAGAVVNTASVAGNPPAGDPVTGTDSVTTTVPASPSIALDKQAGTPSGSSAGDTIDYSFLVTNTGNVTLTSVAVTDPQVGTVTCLDTSLAPGAVTTCSATYVLTQADVDAGHVANSASVAGNPPVGDPVTAGDATDTTIASGPGITLVKTAGTPSGGSAGDTIEYSVLVTNSGNVTLTSVAVTDPQVDTVACSDTTLAPGGSTTCSATYTLTQADVDAGVVVNTASVAGDPPAGDPVTGTDSVTTTVAASPSITLVKTAGTPSGSSAGDTIDYSFLVTNTGNVTLASVTVTDPQVGTVTCLDTSLAPAATTTCSASYVLTQADVDAGVVVNTASVAGNPPAGGPVTDSDSVTTTIPASPALTLDKQSGTPSGSLAGSTIAYAFVVSNTGNVTLDSVGITDVKVGTVTCASATLAPGASTTCGATYVLTQADVDSGHVANSATASGTPPVGAPVTAVDSTDTAISAGPAITLVKTAGTPSGSSAGDTIDYSFLVTNTGNVTLASVAVTDPQVGTVACPDTTLAPGGSTTCSATYTLTHADVDAGVVVNTASVAGNPPAGDPVTGTDSVTTTVPASPSIALDKQAGVPTGSTAGSTIDFSFLVSNTGNVTLSSVAIADLKAGPVTCVEATLAPGASTTCAATYVLTQADVDSGHVANSATASGTPPIGAPVTGADSTDTSLTPGPAMTLVKTAGTPSGNTAGSTIAYSFLVTNTGNVTLTSVSVTDALVGTVTCPDTTLAPGGSTTCAATYTLTQADVDAGSVVNTASVAGNPPAGDPVTGTDSVTTTIPASPSITLVKTAGTPSGSSAGDTIDYSFLVTNSGNVTLASVAVTDPQVGAVSCPDTTLAPGGSTTCAATYVLTQADVDAGAVENTASVAGDPPAGDPVTDTDSTTTTISVSPGIALDKQAGIPTGSTAGSTIGYTFVVTNTGNVTLTAVGITDLKLGAVTCTETTLAPGATTSCASTYVLTQADVDAGHVANSASVAGNPPIGDPVTAGDSTDTAISAGPAITLVKTAGTPSGSSAGDTIDYSFLVTNSGNVTLASVAVTDPQVGAVSCPDTTLAPGASMTCAATYVLTQADVDAGSVVNAASVAGNPPTGEPVTGTDSVTTLVPAAPAITLAKTAGTPSGNSAGDTIAYSFLVTNAGNVTLTSVAVSDPKVGTVTCPDTSLAPAATTTCSATYVLTQADVDAGTVVNAASVAGNPPTGDPVTATDSATTTIPAGPAITLDKGAGALVDATGNGESAGDTVPYTFLVTNTGNVSLSSIAITDAKVGTVTCPETSLAPAASTTCTADYLLTQADVDAGTVHNTASVTANPPTGPAVTANDSVDVAIDAEAALVLDKQAGAPTGGAAGATVTYAFVVTNTGNLTLEPIVIDDPLLGSITCPAGPLAPGATLTCDPIVYSLTQADVDAGHVANTASAVGMANGNPTPVSVDSTDTPINAGPAITLDKTAGAPSGNSAGDTIDYNFLVTNTGNVTLTSVAVTDLKVGTVVCPDTTLAPGASTTCAATYVLTQADVDAGTVVNNASVAGTPPAGEPVTAGDSTTTPVPAGPAITLEKQAGPATGNRAGDTIDYTFLVTNRGNVTLTAIEVTDARVGAVSCPVTLLAPTESTTCTAAYSLTQADVDAGAVHNTAGVTGTPPTGDPVTDTDTVTSPILAGPGIDLAKTGTPAGDRAGDTIAYDFVVTNTGNVTLSAVGVTDAKVGAVTCPVDTLAPAGSTTCTATYLLTQADVDAGVVHNEATATGTPPTGEPVTAPDSVDTPIVPGAAVTIDKQAGIPSAAQVGGTIDYTFVVTNPGNVTLTAVTVSDPTTGPVACPVDTLAPGESTTCTATHTLTRADLDRGEVVNTATVTATPPAGQAVADSDSVTTPLAQVAAVMLDKTADVIEEAQEGDQINFAFVVTNTGNVTLSPVVVSDPMLAAVACPSNTLAAGESMACTGAPYTVTEQDVVLGGLVNSATVSAGFCPVTGCVQVEAGDSVTVSTAIVDPEHEGGGNDHGGNGGGGLAYTGVAGAPELIGLGGGILAAGMLLLLVARRRKA
ncbi:MAG: DUF11 domain-containing protein [Propionibacteriaceae bacterium]|nr:DUF11 domain-containing protein [Propionibacteriaceae bacterium]